MEKDSEKVVTENGVGGAARAIEDAEKRDASRSSVQHDLPARATQPIPEDLLYRDTMMWAFKPDSAKMLERARVEFSQPDPPKKKPGAFWSCLLESLENIVLFLPRKLREG